MAEEMVSSGLVLASVDVRWLKFIDTRVSCGQCFR